MVYLYTCRHSGDQYRITKLDEHLNVESSYLCTTTECECPAGQRPRCRHREMLPQFIARKHVGDGWCLDFDRGGWVQMFDEHPEPETGTPEKDSLDFIPKTDPIFIGVVGLPDTVRVTVNGREHPTVDEPPAPSTSMERVPHNSGEHLPQAAVEVELPVPVQNASQKTAERLPSSDAATAGTGRPYWRRV